MWQRDKDLEIGGRTVFGNLGNFFRYSVLVFKMKYYRLFIVVVRMIIILKNFKKIIKYLRNFKENVFIFFSMYFL